VTGLLARVRTRLIKAVGVHDTAERLAAAWALGIGIGLSPLMGLHTVLALVLAVVFRLNKLDVLLGTLIINPWTFTVYFPAAVLLGRQITGVQIPRFILPHPEALLHVAVWRDNAPWVQSVLLAWGTGAVIVAVLSATATYFLLLRLIRVHRARHLRRHDSDGAARPTHPTAPPEQPGKG
jgi:uncharacterized protein (DUF2062 family)